MRRIQILDSDEAVLYWSEKVKKSIKQINDEIFMKKEKLSALQTLEKVNSLIENKVFTVRNDSYFYAYFICLFQLLRASRTLMCQI